MPLQKVLVRQQIQQQKDQAEEAYQKEQSAAYAKSTSDITIAAWIVTHAHGDSDTHAHGDIMSVYTNDVDTMRMLIGQSLTQLVNSAVTLVTTFVSMIMLSPIMTVLSIVLVTLTMLVSGKLVGMCGKFFVAQQENLEAYRVATVTEEERMVMTWKGNTIANLSRAFLDTNGASKHTTVAVNQKDLALLSKSLYGSLLGFRIVRPCGVDGLQRILHGGAVCSALFRFAVGEADNSFCTKRLLVTCKQRKHIQCLLRQILRH